MTRLAPLALGLCLFAPLAAAAASTGFKASQQQKSPRVRQSFENQSQKVRRLFADRGLAYPPRAIYLRAFKQEGVLELWGQGREGERFELVTSWPICARSGTLGPKRRQGDLQVPEGFYELVHFNPASHYHLSLGVSYPNRSDRILGGAGALGGAIYVHGDCVTIGCLPLGDEVIEQLYVAAVEARDAGQAQIPIDLFPARLTDAKLADLSRAFDDRPELLRFWANLKEGFELFERTRALPCACVAKDGRYRFGEACGAAKSTSTRKPSRCRDTR